MNPIIDLGDCGLSRLSELTEVKLANFSNFETQKLEISERFGNFYFNFSDTEIETVKMAEVNSTDVTTWAAVNSQFKIIPVAIDANQTDSFKFSMRLEYLSKNVTKTAKFDVLVSPVQTTVKPIELVTLPEISSFREMEPENVVQSEVGKRQPIDDENLALLTDRLNQTDPEKLNQLQSDLDSGILTVLGFAEKVQDVSANSVRRKLLSFSFERDEEFKDLALKLTERSQSFKSRKLKDTFGDSLKFVNRMYNQYFG